MQRKPLPLAAVEKSPEGTGGRNYGVMSCFLLNRVGAITCAHAKTCDAPSARHMLAPCH